jgi:hypothetical protein
MGGAGRTVLRAGTRPEVKVMAERRLKASGADDTLESMVERESSPSTRTPRTEPALPTDALRTVVDTWLVPTPDAAAAGPIDAMAPMRLSAVAPAATRSLLIKDPP